MAASLVLALSGIAGSGVDVGASSADRGAQRLEPRVSPEHCDDARRGLAYYKSAAAAWSRKTGSGGRARSFLLNRSSLSAAGRHSCSAIHRAVRFWRAKAREWHRRYERWAYDWNWRAWLPSKWVRVGTCETGLRWSWNSGTYQGAFGFYWGSWDAYKPRGFPAEAYQATPREQWVVAERIRAAVGYGAWGCGGA